MAISKTGDSSATVQSDANQAALEQRFQALYTKMMEKKLEFRESIEPYRTDNENASKG